MRPLRSAVRTPVGELLLRGTEDGTLTGAWFTPGRHPDLAALPRDDAPFARAREQVEEWFAGERTAFDLSLRPAGTPFQRRVWRALAAIPFGATRSYGALAAELETAPRAVGLANGRNPLSLVVPCHRLVGATGALTGYAGGLDVKRRLLAFETGPARR
jgi:methylated-DNA-[protein]-cysteine S-methyltransferase